MVDDLRRIGITPRKSRTVELPAVPDALFFHLLRGYFDGNGTVHLKPRNSLLVKLTAGSAAALVQIAETVGRLLGIDLRPVAQRHGTKHGKPTSWYTTDYCGQVALRIGDAMYRDAGDLYLPRKRDLFAHREYPTDPLKNKARKYDRPLIPAAARLARKRELARARTARYRARLASQQGLSS